mgnify:CR=1 FL=1
MPVWVGSSEGLGVISGEPTVGWSFSLIEKPLLK